MVEINEYLGSLSLKTPSTINEIRAVNTAVTDFLQCYNAENHAVSQITILTRELLINAMKHGNGFHEMTPVIICIAQVNERQFKIVVQDSGKGFDYNSLDTILPEDPKNLRTRGYRLIKAYSDSLEFNRRGNKVTAYVSIR